MLRKSSPEFKQFFLGVKKMSIFHFVDTWKQLLKSEDSAKKNLAEFRRLNNRQMEDIGLFECKRRELLLRGGGPKATR